MTKSTNPILVGPNASFSAAYEALLPAEIWRLIGGFADVDEDLSVRVAQAFIAVAWRSPNDDPATAAETRRVVAAVNDAVRTTARGTDGTKPYAAVVETLRRLLAAAPSAPAPHRENGR